LIQLLIATHHVYELRFSIPFNAGVDVRDVNFSNLLILRYIVASKKSTVSVGILRNEPAIKEQSLVASAYEQGTSDFGIASLFGCVMPSVNGCDLDEPKIDLVILQNNTVSINAEAPVSFVAAESSSLKYVDICLSGDDWSDVKQ